MKTWWALRKKGTKDKFSGTTDDSPILWPTRKASMFLQEMGLGPGDDYEPVRVRLEVVE